MGLCFFRIILDINNCLAICDVVSIAITIPYHVGQFYR